MCVGMCHGIHVNIRGQLVGVRFVCLSVSLCSCACKYVYMGMSAFIHMYAYTVQEDKFVAISFLFPPQGAWGSNQVSDL